MSSNLSQNVKVRVDAKTKRALTREAKRTMRSEGAIIRIAIRRYFDEPTPPAAT